MFDETRSLDDAAVTATITAAARDEAAASARRLAAIAALTTRRCTGPDADARDYWACDTWDSATAEVSAALDATHGVSSSQMRIALALRERLPRLGALLAAGTISYWLARAAVARTTNITDPGALTLVDTALATDIITWGPLALRKTEEAIDFWIDRHDPGAIRRTRAAGRGRDIVIGTADDTAGTTSVWGALLTPDAAALDRRLIELAHTACPDDPAPSPSAALTPPGRTGRRFRQPGVLLRQSHLPGRRQSAAAEQHRGPRRRRPRSTRGTAGPRDIRRTHPQPNHVHNKHPRRAGTRSRPRRSPHRIVDPRRSPRARNHPDTTASRTHPQRRKSQTPSLCIPTVEAPPPVTRTNTRAANPKRDFTRRRTRAQQQTAHIDTERALNDTHTAEVENPPPSSRPSPSGIA
ncbi:hypothetical protein BH09ACT8_BH09ACT8_25460 [soil metagenome]